MKKILAVCAALAGTLAHAESVDITRLPALFTDHMVLQAGKPLPVWGNAPAAGFAVTVTLTRDEDGQTVATATATAGEGGAFKAVLAPVETSAKPHTLRVKSGGDECTVKDVLIGEVWIASGQSNMQWSLGSSKNAKEEIAAADHPLIRLFTVPTVSTLTPQSDVKGKWSVCTPQTAPGFSAVAYFFGRELQKALPGPTPVGLINTSWGGTPAQSWTSIEALENGGFKGYAEAHKKIAAAATDPTPEKLAKYAEDLKAHEASVRFPDFPLTGESLKLAGPATDDTAWPLMDLPGNWEAKVASMKQLNGVVWFRKTVDIPAAWAGKDLVLHAGTIDDTDTTYFNGEKIGDTGKDVPNHWSLQRSYAIPAASFKPGPATIAIRVFDNFASGGVTGGLLSIGPADKSAPPLNLAGGWRYHVEHAVTELPRPIKPGEVNSWTPAGLYNAMIAPLIPYPIAGAIWYQGESNAGNPAEYEKLFPAMINDWRARWGCDFPFLWCQLANFMARNASSIDTNWARLREAQTKTLSLPKTAQAILIDIGEEKDIHPRNKQDVGLRLALAARNIAYGQDVPFRGPTFKSAAIAGDTLTITLDHADGLHFRGPSAHNFAIAGEDGDFAWADAEIKGHTLLLRSPAIAKPFFVRYAWGDNPAANLYNAQDLPAVPFSARAE